MELFLFTSNPGDAKQAFESGIDGFVIDWEVRGKHRRQRDRDTEINEDTPKDLSRMAEVENARRICRLNGFGEWTSREVETAIELGATDLLLPMVKRVEEVESFLGHVDSRVRAGILIETREACDRAKEISRLPLDLVYLGLNDLAISRGTSSIFRPFTDGLALEVRKHFDSIPFGMGGLTVVDAGDPLASMLLMSELARHDCNFTFLRRSFRRDIVGRPYAREVSRIHEAWSAMQDRSIGSIEADRARFADVHVEYEQAL